MTWERSTRGGKMENKNTPFLYEDKDYNGPLVSVSQLQSLMACPQRWSYQYIEKLHPRIERPYLTIGKLCHLGMEAAMKCRWAGSKQYHVIEGCGIAAIKAGWEGFMESVPFLDEEIPVQQDLLDDALDVFCQSLREFNPLRWDVVSVVKDGAYAPALELHFCLPCPGVGGLQGYIDAILRDLETGLTWCVDYKFRKSLAPDDDEQFNIQNAVYMRACRLMGIDVVGSITWQHLNTPAATPTILKSGKISRAKIKTTWQRYSQFCMHNDQDPEDYRDEMEPKLSEIEWWRATKEYRNNATINRIWGRVIVPFAIDVADYKSGKKIVNSREMFPWNCKSCQFAELCQAELRGYDAEYIRSVNYSCDR